MKYVTTYTWDRFYGGNIFGRKSIDIFFYNCIKEESFEHNKAPLYL